MIIQYMPIMNFFNLHIKDMFIDKLDFSISNNDRKEYYKKDHQGIVVVAHAVDDLTILASTPQLKIWTINEICKYYTEITIQGDLETVLRLEVSRDRPSKTITLKQEGSINNCLNAHFPEWRTIPMEELLHCTLPPTPLRIPYWMILH